MLIKAFFSYPQQGVLDSWGGGMILLTYKNRRVTFKG